MIRNFILFCLSLISCLFLTELAVRIFAPQQIIFTAPLIRPDTTFGWRHKENINTVVNFGDGAVHFFTDEDGNRVNFKGQTINKKLPKISILTIGDSFLESLGTENDFSIPGVIRNIFLNKYSREIEVVNTGVSGWGTNQYLLEAKYMLAKKRFDLGIIFLCSNDIVDRKIGRFIPISIRELEEGNNKIRIPKDLSFKQIKVCLFYPINNYLERKSHLFILFKKRFRFLLMRFGLAAVEIPDVYREYFRESDAWHTTADICRDIKDEFARYNTPVFFVWIPDNFQVYEDLFRKTVNALNVPIETVDLQQPNLLLKNIFLISKLTLIDPLYFMRIKAKAGVKMYGQVFCHLNNEGSVIVASYIFPIIEQYILSTSLK